MSDQEPRFSSRYRHPGQDIDDGISIQEIDPNEVSCSANDIFLDSESQTSFINNSNMNPVNLLNQINMLTPQQRLENDLSSSQFDQYYQANLKFVELKNNINLENYYKYQVSLGKTQIVTSLIDAILFNLNLQSTLAWNP
ncbi:MAG: hypothetical protein JSS95_11890 [Acidobacteria bacterium]|nr:hypothetical protein [Acidobacteriota bacterium]